MTNAHLLRALNAGGSRYNAEFGAGASAYKWAADVNGYPTFAAESAAVGDANGDGAIDIADLIEITNPQNYNGVVTEQNRALDLNADGKVNFSDLALARNSKNFGK